MVKRGNGSIAEQREIIEVRFFPLKTTTIFQLLFFIDVKIRREILLKRGCYKWLISFLCVILSALPSILPCNILIYYTYFYIKIEKKRRRHIVRKDSTG